jgi:hypothetical protein
MFRIRLIAPSFQMIPGSVPPFTLLLGDHLSEFSISHSELRGFSRYTCFFSVSGFLLTTVLFNATQGGSSESGTYSPEPCPYVCQIPPDAISIQVECMLIPVVVGAINQCLHSAASSASTASVALVSELDRIALTLVSAFLNPSK